ncbi:hypothetical protein Pcinc_002680 [Petrolisthes cinctipes]|uniref:HTH CENPB-type domain-containing protein n=1 Tax=Petrolisthes cinctipes TaxID=88211 RepID=A0AAE1GKX1_PETCI|nr:hypothetical protein Pcinc_002680 [Petrolisthes cinctipes]
MAGRAPKPPTVAERNAKAPGREIKKRKNLTYAEKLEIIKKIDGGVKKRAVGVQFGINESTVRGIYAKREYIRNHIRMSNSEGALNVKRSRNQVLLKTEQLLGRYMDRMARRNESVDTKDIMDTALDIYGRVARKLGVQQPPLFLASKGWLDKFIRRQKVTSKVLSGEAASANTDAARDYPEELRNIIEEGGYTPDQIFNMDETNFYWKTLPKRTFITERSVKVRGRKPIRQRFTLCFTTNATGTCRLKPTVIHRAVKPRAYKHQDMKKINVHWMTSKKGYMNQFRMMKDATRDDALLQSLVDSNDDDEDSDDQQRNDNEHEKNVLSYWKNYNIKQAVDLVVECWNNVTQRTIHHAWRKILAALPEENRGNVAGEIQSVEEVAEAAAAEARQVPGGGFDNTNVDDIMDMIRPPPPTAAEILEEDELAEEEGDEEEEEGGGESGRPGALSVPNIKELIELGDRMQHLLEQDRTINSEARCAFVLKALEGYHDQYNAHVNNFRQRQITDFLRRRNEAQEPQPGPSHATSDSENEDNNFEGFGPFQTAAEADNFLDAVVEHRRGGQ